MMVKVVAPPGAQQSGAASPAQGGAQGPTPCPVGKRSIQPSYWAIL